MRSNSIKRVSPLRLTADLTYPRKIVYENYAAASYAVSQLPYYNFIVMNCYSYC